MGKDNEDNTQDTVGEDDMLQGFKTGSFGTLVHDDRAKEQGQNKNVYRHKIYIFISKDFADIGYNDKGGALMFFAIRVVIGILILFSKIVFLENGEVRLRNQNNADRVQYDSKYKRVERFYFHIILGLRCW